MERLGTQPRNQTEARATAGLTPTAWAIAVVWFGVSTFLGARGFYSEHARAIPLLVLGPVAVYMLAFAFSQRLRAWTLAFDLKELVAVQTARVGGIAFLAVYAVGQLNPKFALWAGGLDCVVGFSAPFAAHYLAPPRTARQWFLLVAWIAIGVVDFLVAIPLARICRIEDPASMSALSRPPLSMITQFFVPLALIDYLILSAQLWRLRSRSVAAAGSVPPGAPASASYGGRRR